MILEVDFYHLEGPQGDQVKFATLRWDGKTFMIDPPGHRQIQEVLDTAVHLPKGGGWVTSQENPEAFMRGLCTQYRSYTFGASDIREVSEGSGSEVTP